VKSGKAAKSSRRVFYPQKPAAPAPAARQFISPRRLHVAAGTVNITDMLNMP
jgi:hypothetical protein